MSRTIIPERIIIRCDAPRPSGESVCAAQVLNPIRIEVSLPIYSGPERFKEGTYQVTKEFCSSDCAIRFLHRAPIEQPTRSDRRPDLVS